MPRLSIVIVTFNSKADIGRCLEALTAAPPQTTHEVIVVDNASGDGTRGFLRDRFPHVHVVDAGSNVGFAKANNIGIRMSQGDLVLLLNPDTEAGGEAIDALVRYLDAHARTGAIGPKIVDGGGQPELSWGPMLSPLAEARQKYLASSAVPRLTARSRDVDWVSGACLLARRADLDAAGLFDERFFLYTEDVDLCASLRALGKRVHFLADVRIVHHRGRSGATAPAATRAAYRRSHLAFYEKHHPRWAPLLRWYLKLKGELPDTP